MKNEIISRFNQKPKLAITWWAMRLGLATVLSGPFLGTSAAVLRPAIDRAGGESLGSAIGIVLVMLILALVVSAFGLGLYVYRKGERSWVMWIGFIPAILAVLFWLFMVIGEFVFPH